MLPLKLRPPLRQGPCRDRGGGRWQQTQSNPLSGDGQTTGRAGREYSEGRDLGRRSRPSAWADRGRGRRVAGEVSARRGERASESTAGRRGVQGRAHQEAQTEDRGSRAGQRYVTGGLEALPFGPEDIRHVKAAVSGVSERRSCQVLGVSRAGLHRHGSGTGEMPSGRSTMARSAPPADSAASHLWLSTAGCAAALSRRDPRQWEGRLPSARTSDAGSYINVCPRRARVSRAG